MKTEKRYCKKCKEYTLQDKVSMDSRDPNGWQRAFLAVATVGFAEAIRESGYRCQVCGNKTPKH